MKQNLKEFKVKIELFEIVAFPSFVLGLTIALGIFVVMGWDINVESSQRFFTVATISSLASAIYFSIKTTIWVMENKQKELKKKRNNVQKVSFEKNPKLYNQGRAVS